MGTIQTHTSCYTTALCESWIHLSRLYGSVCRVALLSDAFLSGMLDARHIRQPQHPVQWAAQACWGHA